MRRDRRASSVCREEAKYSQAHEPHDRRTIPQHVHQSAWDQKIQGADSELKEDRERVKILYGFVKNEELCFFGLSDELDDEIPEVQALNRGLNTIHNRMMMLRRRYGCLLKAKRASTGDGKLIKRKLDSYKKDLAIMKDQIVAKGGKYCITPEIFDEDIVLID